MGNNLFMKPQNFLGNISSRVRVINEGKPAWGNPSEGSCVEIWWLISNILFSYLGEHRKAHSERGQPRSPPPIMVFKMLHFQVPLLKTVNQSVSQLLWSAPTSKDRRGFSIGSQVVVNRGSSIGEPCYCLISRGVMEAGFTGSKC